MHLRKLAPWLLSTTAQDAVTVPVHYISNWFQQIIHLLSKPIQLHLHDLTVSVLPIISSLCIFLGVYFNFVIYNTGSGDSRIAGSFIWLIYFPNRTHVLKNVYIHLPEILCKYLVFWPIIQFFFIINPHFLNFHLKKKLRQNFGTYVHLKKIKMTVLLICSFKISNYRVY